MASFDIIKAAGMGFSFIWDNRAIVTRMALIPFAIKWVTLILIILSGLQDNYLRQGLLMLPSYFLEGWLMAYFIRLAVFQENIFTLAAGDEHSRRRNKIILDSMLAGALLYVLLNLVTSLLWGLLLPQERPMAPPSREEPSLAMFMLAMAAMYGSIWAVRIFWLHIPVILGFDLKSYFEKMRGIKSSLFVLGTWLLCVVPLAAATFLLADIMAVAMGHTPETPSMAFHFIMLGVQAGVEIIINLVSGIAIALGICAIMRPPAEKNMGS